MPKRCPGCGNEVPADAEVCPFCPMSFRNEDFSPSGRKRRSHSSLGVFALLGLGLAFGFGAWQVLDWLLRTADGRNERPGPAAPSPSAEIPDSSSRESPVPEGPTDSAPSFIQISPESEGRRGAAATQPALQRPKRPVSDWRLRGTVYDLASLAPLPRCRLIFSDALSGTRYETMTDAHGRYRIFLTPLEGRGYNLRIERQGYAAAFLENGDDIERKGAPERRSLAEALAKSLKPSPPLRPDGDKPLVTNLYLAAEL